VHAVGFVQARFVCFDLAEERSNLHTALRHAVLRLGGIRFIRPMQRIVDELNSPLTPLTPLPLESHPQAPPSPRASLVSILEHVPKGGVRL
jgi:hypothetical protein